MPSLGTIIKGTIGFFVLLFIAGAVWYRALRPCDMLREQLRRDGGDPELVAEWTADMSELRCARILPARLLIGRELD